MIEAMACGSPVVAFDRGSVSEVVEHGLTGLIVEDVASAVAALERVGELDRARIRRRFEERFTTTHMARRYVEVYQRLVASEPMPVRAA